MYLGIDLGDKRCGIALEVEKVVIPKAIVPRVQLVQTLKSLIHEYSITDIIIGYPYDLYQKDNKQLIKTQKYIKKLQKIFPHIQIRGVDERFTTFEAKNILQDISKTYNTDKCDDIAAALILETYIKQQNTQEHSL